MMNCKVRPMLKEDRETVVRILKNTSEFTAEEVGVSTELIDIYLEQGDASGYHTAVAQADFLPAGYICYGHTPMTTGTWDVYWLAVDPGRKRQGIGRVLLGYAEERMFKAGARMILIETSSKPSYEDTRKFYYSMNYTVIAEIPDFYAVGDGKTVFQKKNA